MSGALVISALLLGLLGAPHCAAMCGGLVAASNVGKRRLPQAGGSRLTIVGAQNLGRAASYATGGAIVGAMGQLVGRGAASEARGIAQLVAAVALLAAGLALLGLVPARASLERFGAPLWRRVQPIARRLLPIDTPRRAVAFGLLWGMVPCGLVYSALALAAVSGSAPGGVAVMLGFAAGTAPAMLAVGAFAQLVARLTARTSLRRVAGAAIVCFGLFQLVVGARALAPSHGPCCPPHEVAVTRAR